MKTFDMTKAVNARVSVRNYMKQGLDETILADIKTFIDAIDNPFDSEVNFHFLDQSMVTDGERIGTYGVIKGATQYIGATIKDEPMALEALGYVFETLVLYLASVGIGTCWLGGTFNRQGFKNVLGLDAQTLFPIVTPIGYPADKKHVVEVMMRRLIKADQRKPWETLFFQNSFDTPLEKKGDEPYEHALEMLRLAPSASNKQPWRVVKDNDNWHFYEQFTPGYSDAFKYDIQRIEVGIAEAHFDLALKQLGISGSFSTLGTSHIVKPNNTTYLFSWGCLGV